MTIGATLLPAIDALATQVAAAGGALADLRAAAAALDPPRKPTGVRSGLPSASGKRQGSVFRSVLEPTTASFEEMRGRPCDFELVFVDNWKNSTAPTWMAGCDALKPASGLPWLASQGVAVVLTVPLFPNGGLAGVLPAGKARFADVVEGGYDEGRTEALAGGIAAPGVEVIGLRVGWEANGGFPWCHQFCEGDYALWRGAYKHVAGLWKARSRARWSASTSCAASRSRRRARPSRSTRCCRATSAGSTCWARTATPTSSRPARPRPTCGPT